MSAHRQHWQCNAAAAVAVANADLPSDNLTIKHLLTIYCLQRRDSRQHIGSTGCGSPRLRWWLPRICNISAFIAEMPFYRPHCRGSRQPAVSIGGGRQRRLRSRKRTKSLSICSLLRCRCASHCRGKRLPTVSTGGGRRQQQWRSQRRTCCRRRCCSGGRRWAGNRVCITHPASSWAAATTGMRKT